MRNWIFIPIFTAFSAIALAATPFDLNESHQWAIQNVLDAESYAILEGGKANIIDTPDITRLEDLYKRFYENEIAVLQGYKDKPRLISFPVGRVAVENGVPVVYGAWSSPTVKYVFDSNSIDALSKTGRGSIFPAVCSLRSINRGALEFTKCRAGQEYIDNHIAVRRSEIMDFLAGKTARRAETSKQAVTLLSLIFSMPSTSRCLKKPAPELYCFSRLEFKGNSLIDSNIREAVMSELRSRGFQL